MYLYSEKILVCSFCFSCGIYIDFDYLGDSGLIDYHRRSFLSVIFFLEKSELHRVGFNYLKSLVEFASEAI